MINAQEKSVIMTKGVDLLSRTVGSCHRINCKASFPRKYFTENDTIIAFCEKSAGNFFTNECFYNGENWLKKLQCEKCGDFIFHTKTWLNFYENDFSVKKRLQKPQ